LQTLMARCLNDREKCRPCVRARQRWLLAERVTATGRSLPVNRSSEWTRAERCGLDVVRRPDWELRS
jgi:hypothetical protein